MVLLYKRYVFTILISDVDPCTLKKKFSLSSVIAPTWIVVLTFPFDKCILVHRVNKLALQVLSSLHVILPEVDSNKTFTSLHCLSSYFEDFLLNTFLKLIFTKVIFC